MTRLLQTPIADWEGNEKASQKDTPPCGCPCRVWDLDLEFGPLQLVAYSDTLHGVSEIGGPNVVP